MLPRIPPLTRILLIPSDRSGTHEFTISRRMIRVIGALLVLIVLLLALLMLSYSSLLRQARRVPELQSQLVAANGQVVHVQELTRELENMRDMQERLLTMLGVEQARDDGDDPHAGPLDDAASVVMTPPPDRWPVHGEVTREFTRGNLANGVEPHPGIDLAAPLDTPIHAAGRGVVQNADWDDELGNYVEIRHGFGYVTVYAHCNRLAVQRGDRVDAGQVIAYLGGTGHADAPHLYFEVWRDGEAVDPRAVIPGDPGTQ